MAATYILLLLMCRTQTIEFKVSEFSRDYVITWGANKGRGQSSKIPGLKKFEGKRSRDVYSGHVTQTGIIRVEYYTRSNVWQLHWLI